MNTVMRRVNEIVGMLMLGDGTIAAIAPQEHIELWRGGPRAWRDVSDWFSRRPAISRVVGISVAAVGLWLMLSQLEPPRRRMRLRPPRRPASYFHPRTRRPFRTLHRMPGMRH